MSIPYELSEPCQSALGRRYNILAAFNLSVYSNAGFTQPSCSFASQHSPGLELKFSMTLVTANKGRGEARTPRKGRQSDNGQQC